MPLFSVILLCFNECNIFGIKKKKKKKFKYIDDTVKKLNDTHAHVF